MNPSSYVAVTDEWLPDWSLSDDERPVVFARSALGDLLMSYKGRIGQLNVHYGRYVDVGPGHIDVFLGYSIDEDYLQNALDGKLVLEAVKKLGPLAADEMYTFEPALALGGAAELKQMKRVKLFPQLSLLVQLYDDITIE